MTRAASAVALLCVAAATLAWAQDASLPTVPDSPTCQQQLLHATLQAEENPQGSLRSLAEALETPDALVPVDAEALLFRPVRWHVCEQLRAAPALLRAWQEAMGPRAERALAEAGPLETWRRWPGTQAGIRAGLLLVREAIARGAPDAAQWRLDMVLAEPGFGEEEEVASAQRLRAMLQGDASAAGGPRGAPSGRLPSISPAGVPPDPSWRVPLPDLPLPRARAATADRGEAAEAVELRADAGRFRAALPALADGTAMVCVGPSVIAFDALTHMRRWTVGSTALSPEPGTLAMTSPVVQHGTAYALVGKVDQPNRLSALLAVRIETGALLWVADCGEDGMRLGGEPEMVEGVGLVAALEDTVAVQARRIDARAQVSATVQGFDASRGWKRWKTPLGTAPQVGTGMRPPTQLLAHGGTLLVPSTVGTYARVEAETGDIVWLARMANPLRPTEGDRRPFELVSGAVTGSHWVVLSPDDRSIVAFDIASGATTRVLPTGPGTLAGEVRYLIAVDAAVVAVGRGLACLDENLDHALWRLDDVVPAGRVMPAVMNGSPVIVVPREDRIEVRAIDDGSVAAHWAAPACNPAIGPAGVVGGTDDALVGWVPTVGAIDRLLNALAENPGDIPAACALLDLGLQARDASIIAQGCRALAQAVTAAGSSATAAGLEEFLGVLTRAASAPAVPRASFAELARAAREASLPGDASVRARMCEAAWLASIGEWREGIASYWSIVTDATAARLMIPGGAEGAGSSRMVRAPIAAGAALAALARANGGGWPTAEDGIEHEWLMRLAAAGGPRIGAAAARRELESLREVEPAASVIAEGLQQVMAVPGQPVVLRHTLDPVGSGVGWSEDPDDGPPGPALDNLALFIQPRIIDAYGLAEGTELWQAPIAGSDRRQGTFFRLGGDRLLSAGWPTMVVLDAATGRELARQDRIEALLPPEQLPGRPPLATGSWPHALATSGDMVLIAHGAGLSGVAVQDGHFERVWSGQDNASRVLTISPVGSLAWLVVAHPAANESGSALGIRLIEAETGNVVGSLDGLPWSLGRSLTVVSEDTLVLRLPTATLCIRRWGRELLTDWTLSSGSVSKGIPDAIPLGDMLVPGDGAGLVRGTFDGAAAGETGLDLVPDDTVTQWILTSWGALCWNRSGLWALSQDAEVVGAAVIPPGLDVRGCAIDRAAVAVLLSEERQGAFTPGPSAVSLGILDLSRGLRWAGPLVTVPGPDARMVVGPLALRGQRVLIRLNGVGWFVGPS